MKNYFSKISKLKVRSVCVNAPVGEPSGQILEPQFFDNLLHVFKILTTELGFTYYNGKVAIIDLEEVSNT